MTEPSASVTILDPGWPGRALRLMPGDLSKWLPQGFGLGAPLVVTPYSDGPEPSYYGFDAAGSNPILNAPTQQPGSGVLYFDDGADLTKLRGALGIIGVRLADKTYAVFWDATIDTIEDRYLHQVRIVSKAALGYLFKANPGSVGATRPAACLRRLYRDLHCRAEGQVERRLRVQPRLERYAGRRRRLGQGIAWLRLRRGERLLGRLPAVEPALAVHEMMLRT